MNTNQQMPTQTNDKMLTFFKHEIEAINNASETLDINTTDFISKAAFEKYKKVSSLVYLYRRISDIVNNDFNENEMREKCTELLPVLRNMCLVLIGF